MLLTPPFRALSQKGLIIRSKLSANPIAYRLASGAFWSLVGMICSKLLSVLATVIVARLLGKEAYGAMGMVISTMGAFAVLAGFGLGSTSTKYIAEYKQTDPAKAGRIYGLTTVVALLTSGTIPPRGVKLSCMAFTEPFEAAVVAAAQRPDHAGPTRASFPSMLPPG